MECFTSEVSSMKNKPWHKRPASERKVALFYENSLSPEDRKAVEACTDYRKPPKLLGTYERGSCSPLGGAMKSPTAKGKR
jgi:hypothetical protein